MQMIKCVIEAILMINEYVYKRNLQEHFTKFKVLFSYIQQQIENILLENVMTRQPISSFDQGLQNSIVTCMVTS